jgi:hypothetical protein
MGGIRALPAAGLEQMMRGSDIKNGVQQHRLGGSRNQMRTELAQHRAVGASVGQWQAEKVLPTNLAPDGIGRMAISAAGCRGGTPYMRHGHASARTTNLYDCRGELVSLDKVERISL